MKRRLYGEPFGGAVFVDGPPGTAGRYSLTDDNGLERRFDKYEEAVRFIARQWVLRLIGGTRQ